MDFIKTFMSSGVYKLEEELYSFRKKKKYRLLLCHLLLTITNPPLAQAINVTYHSTIFGAHSPILSPLWNPNLISPPANRSASSRRLSYVNDLSW